MNTNIYMRHPKTGTSDMGASSNDGFFGQDDSIPESVIVEPSLMPDSALLARSEEEEIANLAEAMNDETPTYVDGAGVIHIDGEANSENMTKVDGNVFGVPTAEEEEVAALAKAMQDDNGEGYFVDEFGRIRLSSEPDAGVNTTKVDGNVFGVPTAEEEEVARIAKAMQEDNGDGYFVDEFGRIRLGSEPDAGVNMTKVDGHVFGAHEDQWYKKNPQLFRAEVATMRKHYPKAGYDFLKSNGNMYWLVTLQILKTPGAVKPWVFQLVYDKDHPHNHGFGGSIKVVPLRPSLDDLKKIATQYGRPGVPHVIYNESHFLKRYLCTRWPKDIESGDELVSSATQAAAWAADWAAHFEVGIRDKKVWNKWCDDDHFRHMQVE